MQNNDGSSKQRRLTRSTKALLLGLAGALLLGVLLFGGRIYLSWRVGPDYYGKPETLLPADTALMATWSNFSSFLTRLEGLHAMEQIRQDEKMATFLLADPTWRKLEKDKNKAHYKILSTMASDFVDKWMGRELTFAIVPPAQSTPSDDPTTAPTRSAMLLIARTNFGFEHNLAELVAQFYPELALEERVYRGQRIYRYNARKTRRAFTYCRFGRTVVMSLRSPAWGQLERVIDLKIDARSKTKMLASLAASPAFIEASKRFAPGDSLNAYASPRYLQPAMRALPSASAGSEGWDFWIDYFTDKTQRVDWGQISLSLAQGLRLDSFWKCTKIRPTQAVARTDDPAGARSAYADIPANPTAVLVAQSDGIRNVLLELRARMKESKSYRKGLAKFEKKWAKQTGSKLATDWVEPMGQKLGIVITGFSNGLLFPLPMANAWWTFSKDEGATRLEQALTAHARGASSILIPIGQLSFQAQNNSLLLDLNGGGAQGSSPSTGDASSSHPLLAELRRLQPEPVVSLFVDFQSAYAHLARMYQTASLWSKKVRKNVQQWTTILGILQYMDALRLTATPVRDGVRVEIVIPVR